MIYLELYDSKVKQTSSPKIIIIIIVGVHLETQAQNVNGSRPNKPNTMNL